MLTTSRKVILAETRSHAKSGLHVRLIVKKEGGYVIDRSGKEYLQALSGLGSLFEYVTHLSSNKVLDIGAGTTRGIHDLSTSPLGKGLDFNATILSRAVHASLKLNLSEEKTRITSAEVLRGVEKDSIAAIISLWSITYSEEPALTVKSIDRVLVPGGVVKAKIFRDDSLATAPGGLSRRVMSDFKPLFEALGYDVAEDKNLPGILLAVKPFSDGAFRIPANELIKLDYNSVGNQVALLESSSNDVSSSTGPA